MLSLLLIHFLPTWLVGGLGLWLLHRRPFPAKPLALRQLTRAVLIAICFVPVLVGGSWLTVPVPIPSFLGDALIQGDALGTASRRVMAPLVIGTAAGWLGLMAGSAIRHRSRQGDRSRA